MAVLLGKQLWLALLMLILAREKTINVFSACLGQMPVTGSSIDIN